MEDTHSNWRPMLVAAVLLLLSLLYVGSYAAFVTPFGWRTVQIAPGIQETTSQNYRCGDFPAKVIFWPQEQLDRKLRPSAWELNPLDSFL